MPCIGGFVYELVFWLVVSFVSVACVLLIFSWRFLAFEVVLLAVVILVFVGAGFARAIFWEEGARRFFLRMLSKFASRSFVEVFQGESGEKYVGFSFDILYLHLVELEMRSSEITRLICKPSQEMANGLSDDSWQVVLRYSRLPEVERKTPAARRHDFHYVGPSQRKHEAQQLAGRIASLLQSAGVNIRVGD